jgi:hypothetical protein
MLRFGNLSRTLSLGIALATLTLYSGCFVVSPSPEYALYGTWELTNDQSTDLTQTLLTFDTKGQLTSVSYTALGVTVTNDNITGTSNVSGNNVTISTTFGANSLNFVGVFNADKTVATGEGGTSATLGGFTISVDNGPVTLTKL